MCICARERMYTCAERDSVYAPRKSERSERNTHAEKEASAASELYARRKQASDPHTRRKKRAQRAKHTLETEASESRTRRKKRATHTRRKKRANHTDEKRGRRETNSKRVFRTLKAKLCQSVPIRAHPCRSGPLYTILCHPCRFGAFYAIPCQAVSIRAIRDNPSNPEASQVGCV